EGRPPFFQAAVAKPPQPQPFHRALLSPDNLSSRTRAEPPTPQHTMCECRSLEGAGVEDVAAAASEAAERALRRCAREPGFSHAFWLLTQLPLAAREKDF